MGERIMRLLYTIDLYLNALLQMILDGARSLRIHPVWFRVVALSTSVYFFLTSAVASAVRHDVFGTFLVCFLLVCPLMFLTFNMHELFLVIVGERKMVDEGRRRNQDKLLKEQSLTARPIYLIGVCALLAIGGSLSAPLLAFTLGFLYLVIDLYLETCV